MKLKERKNLVHSKKTQPVEKKFNLLKELIKKLTEINAQSSFSVFGELSWIFSRLLEFYSRLVEFS